MAPETDGSDPNIEDLGRRYRALLMSAQSAGPDDEVWKELAETRKALGTAKQREEEKAKTTAAEGQTKTTSPVGSLLGAETTGLEATTALGLQPVPTGIYHLGDGSSTHRHRQEREPRAAPCLRDGLPRRPLGQGDQDV